MTRWTRRAALGLMGSGAGFLVWGSSGFTQVNAVRDTSVDTVDDPSALLGIDGREAAETPTFTNNADEASMNVELDSGDDIEFDVGDDGDFQSSVAFDINPGETTEVALDGGVDVADVEINVTLQREDRIIGSISLVREYEIPQSAAISEVIGETTSPGGSGKYEFSLINQSERDVAIDGIGIVEVLDDPTNAEKVGGRNNDDILVLEDDGRLVYEVIQIGGDIRPFLSADGERRTVSLPPNEAVVFEFLRFRDDENNSVGVDDVDITIRAEDGSTTIINLRE